MPHAMAVNELCQSEQQRKQHHQKQTNNNKETVWVTYACTCTRIILFLCVPVHACVFVVDNFSLWILAVWEVLLLGALLTVFFGKVKWLAGCSWTGKKKASTCFTSVMWLVTACWGTEWDAGVATIRIVQYKPCPIKQLAWDQSLTVVSAVKD